MHVYDPESLQVRADIPLADAAMVRVGQAAPCGRRCPAGPGVHGEGHALREQADISKNTIEAKVEIDDQAPAEARHAARCASCP